MTPLYRAPLFPRLVGLCWGLAAVFVSLLIVWQLLTHLSAAAKGLWVGVFPAALFATAGVWVGRSSWGMGLWETPEGLLIRHYKSVTLPWETVRGVRLALDPFQFRTGTNLVVSSESGDRRVPFSALVDKRSADMLDVAVRAAAKRHTTS